MNSLDLSLAFFVGQWLDLNVSWSNLHSNCINCGTKDIRHAGGGLCRKCYQQSRENSYSSQINKLVGHKKGLDNIITKDYLNDLYHIQKKSLQDIAKILGCKTIGLTSSEEKKSICLNNFGYDHVINYKESKSISADIKKHAPEGVDCFFDNVGGEQFDSVMENINIGARITICGTIGMPSFPIPLGPRVNRTLILKRAKIEGLLVLDYFHRYEEIYKYLSTWYKEGKIKDKEDISYGLETAPSSLIKLLEGNNVGKQLVKL